MHLILLSSNNEKTKNYSLYFSSSIPSISNPIQSTNNCTIKSSTNFVNNNTNQASIILNRVTSNDNWPVDKRKIVRRSPKRRSISATASNSISIIDKNRREKRTNSASNSPLRMKCIINRKRSLSPSSITLPILNKNSKRRKKQKIIHYWILFGKSEQKLVFIHVRNIDLFLCLKFDFLEIFKTDKPPVLRECYTSIQHVTEKDVIKSNDCVILRPETGTRNSVTPYVAKVKWFWKEPTSGN